MPVGMNPAQARVFDPILTGLVQGYENTDFIGIRLMPFAETNVSGGQIIQFNDTMFRTYGSIRSPGADYARITTGYAGLPFQLLFDGLEHPIPDEYKNDAAAQGIAWPEFAMNAVMAGLNNNLEVEIATLLTTTGSYASTNRVTLSGSDQLSDDTSNMSETIATGRNAIRAATGKYPNVIAFSAAAYEIAKFHPDARDQYKHTSPESITIQMLAAMYDFQVGLVGTGIKANDAGVKSDIWGKDIVMAYVNPRALNGSRIPFSRNALANRFEPSMGYTYVMTGHPFAKPMYRENRADSDVYGATFHRRPVKTGVNTAGEIIAGYLIKAAVA